MPVPATRGEAIALLQKLGWNDEELGPEERQAVRDLYRLDDTRTLAEALSVGRGV